ncbi:hypothetical protein BT67DRAFT_356761, partial [Trichocladium antarcticum]
TSFLLRIPGELRNQIYENLVVFSDPVHIYQQTDDSRAHEPAGSGLHAVLASLFLTCRQVHGEASAIFYSQNKFMLPANSSAASHQFQANFLFRWFVDRIGPRNATALRHLSVPFPVDPAALISTHFSTSDFEDSENTIIPTLQRQCPNLETLDFDIRWNNHWVRLLCPNTPTVHAVFGRLDDALRSAFPKLKGVGLCFAAPGRKYVFTNPFVGNSEEMPPAEWEWFTQTLAEGNGWQVDTAPADLVQDDETPNAPGADGAAESQGEQVSPWGVHTRSTTPPGTHVPWLTREHAPTPRDAAAVLYERPAMATVDDEDLERDGRFSAAIAAKAKYAKAWLRSPRQAALDREAAEEWMQWRRTMLAQAGPYSFSSCFGTGSIGGASGKTSRRRMLARRLRNLL